MFLPTNSTNRVYDIGEGSSALFCLTDREACCSGDNRRGAWRFPNGSSVGGDSSRGFYITRGSSSLLLNRRSSATGPAGEFTCLIPNASDTIRTVRIEIFSE